MSRVIKPEAVLARLRQEHGSMAVKRLAESAGRATGYSTRAVQAYLQRERRITQDFSERFAAAYPGIADDSWENAKPRSARGASPQVSQDGERLYRKLIKDFCTQCAGDPPGKGSCFDATCILRPVSPMKLAGSANTKAPILSSQVDDAWQYGPKWANPTGKPSTK